MGYFRRAALVVCQFWIDGLRQDKGDKGDKEDKGEIDAWSTSQINLDNLLVNKQAIAQSSLFLSVESLNEQFF